MRRVLLSLTIGLATAVLPLMASAEGGSFLNSLPTARPLTFTVPNNGDLNPYGVAVVPITRGKLVRNHVLVSNFNNAQNQQGTGHTIVQVAPNGTLSEFARIDPANVAGRCPGGVGLTTALVALRSGFVIVGSLPTTDGTSATAQAGCLIVLNSGGEVVQTLHGGGINGPWDMTAVDFGYWALLFVTNELNGTVQAKGAVVNEGTVLRILIGTPDEDKNAPIDLQRAIIGSRFAERSDPAALVVGPTGLGISHSGILYVADTVANRIAAIPDALFRRGSAGIGVTVSEGGALNGPLGLTIAPDGHILTANAGDGNLVETTPAGEQVSVRAVDTTGAPPGAGTLFGLAVGPDRKSLYFVDDGDNTLRVLNE